MIDASRDKIILLADPIEHVLVQRAELEDVAQYCLKHTDETDKRYATLKDMVSATRRCIDIIQNMLTIARTGTDKEKKNKLINPAELVNRALKFLRYRLDTEKVHPSFYVLEPSTRIYGCEEEIQELMLNLITNAVDALEGRKSKEIKIRIFRQKEYLNICVMDNGPGIGINDQEKVFEPFYTTKPAGKGTGLGLSICRKIVEDHGGKIILKSNPGQGTNIHVLLPVAEIMEKGDVYEKENSRNRLQRAKKAGHTQRFSSNRGRRRRHRVGQDLGRTGRICRRQSPCR